MKRKFNEKAPDLPSIEQLKAESGRTKYKKRFRHAVRNTIFTLVTVSAAAVLIAVLFLPVLRIYGSSMDPTLDEGNLVVSVKGSTFETGDIIAFYYNNKILVKRVIAKEGDYVRLDKDGNVYVNDKQLDEPYVSDLAVGECDNEDLMGDGYQVPESRYFVMGDHRSVSVDSRSSSVGCVAEEQVVGKIVFCVWPFSSFGKVGAD